MKISIFNPFKRIAGYSALTIGLLFILLTTITAYYSGIYYPDMISVKLGLKQSFLILLFENISNWLVPVVIFYLSILLFSKTSFRFIDLAGTFALARVPYVITALTGFIPAQEKFAHYILSTYLKTGEPIQISNTEIGLAIIIGIVTMLIIIWMIALLYNAFKTISNLKTGKAVAIFIPSVIISIGITMILFFSLYKQYI